MATSVKNFLHSFELLSDDEKRELASEIMRRTVKFDLPPLTDEDLIICAEEVFLKLDQSETCLLQPTVPKRKALLDGKITVVKINILI